MTTIELIRKHKPEIRDLPKMSPFMRDWASWYKGNVRNYHNYRVYNGAEYVEVEMKSMQMGKVISEKWADLLLNERCKFVIPESDQDKLDNILNENNFWYRANNSLEKTFGIGIGAWYLTIEGLEKGNLNTLKKDNARLKINYIDAFKIQPITIDNGEITECAFESNSTDVKTVIIHVRENEVYKIYSYKLRKDKIIDHNVFDTKSSVPYFWIVRPNIANNLNDEYTFDEMGMSILANAIDGLKDLDAKYDAFYNETVLKRPRIFLTEQAYKIDVEEGKKIKTFDPRSTQFYYQLTDDEGKKKVETVGDNLRTNDMVTAINAQLNYVGMKCGFGQKFFRFDTQGEVTATQVISENSTLYRSIKKHELILENVLRKMIKAIVQASNEFTRVQFSDFKDEDIVIRFDDSIIEDKGAEQARDKEEVAAGLMSREEYRIKWYGEDKDTAKANVRDYFLNEIIDDYTPALVAGAITPKQFVEKVYGDIENKEEVIAYITSQVQAGSLDDFNEELYGDGETATHIVTVTNQGGEEETIEVTATDDEDAISQVLDMLDVPKENIKSVKAKEQ